MPSGGSRSPLPHAAEQQAEEEGTHQCWTVMDDYQGFFSFIGGNCFPLNLTPKYFYERIIMKEFIGTVGVLLIFIERRWNCVQATSKLLI